MHVPYSVVDADSVLLTRAVRCLIPRDSIPCASVLRLLGSLKGQTLSLQLLIIRWIILVYDIIDNHSGLHGIYGLLFYYLQFDDLVLLFLEHSACVHYP